MDSRSAVRLALALVIFQLPCVAQASIWNFSYTFNGGNTISGSFAGDLSPDGLVVQNVDNVSVTFHGRLFVGSPNLFTAGYNMTTNTWDFSTPAIISFDPLKNNFLFIDIYDLHSQATKNSFAMYNLPTGYSDAWAIDPIISEGQSPIDNSWRLTPVPVPAAYVLFLTGLGFLGLTSHRFKKN